MNCTSYFSVLLIIIFCSTGEPATGNNGNIITDSTVFFIEGSVAPYNTLEGGDTLFLSHGHRDYLLIRNLHGEQNNPIVIINLAGIVTIDTDHHFGVSIENSTFFKFTGTGDSSALYGIRIERVGNGGGFGISKNCSDFEVDHIYIGACPIGSLYAKTDPDCSFTNSREKFTQWNTIIHDNYITNSGNEGMYIGNTKYFGMQVHCNGKDTLLMPPLLKGVRIYNNILNYINWDGIQVSSASEDCEIYDNTIIDDSQDGIVTQMSGILIGGGSNCDCYNNYIKNGKGSGIEVHGIGNSRIFNNIIENAGKTFKPSDLQAMKYGIYVTDVSATTNASFFILFNDIINPKSDGIRFTSVLSRNNLIASNVVINPGNFDFYENGHFTFKGKDSYVMIPDTNADVLVKNNYFARNSDHAGFFPASYALQPGSPLIDAGYIENKGIGFDFYRHPRLFGSAFDVGAFEFNPSFLSVSERKAVKENRPVVQPNPVKNNFRITYTADAGSRILLWLLDLQGKPLTRQACTHKKTGVAAIELDVQGLPDGYFLYYLRIGANVYSGKVLKQ